MADKTPILQQPVISIRISDELRQRLDTLKEIMAAKSGEPVSTSEAAKQLLESSKEERLEFVNLLSEPTDSLVKIRGKVDAKLPLSQAEWTLVAYYCQQGADEGILRSDRALCQCRGSIASGDPNLAQNASVGPAAFRSSD